MKRIANLAGIAALVLALTLLVVGASDMAYTQQKGKTAEKGFVDKNGDGINDNAKDHDGDGIPNGRDPDYVAANDGSGQQMGKGKKGSGPNAKGTKARNQAKVKGQAQIKLEQRNRAKGFVDANGDGINDNARDADGDGIPNGQDPDYNRQNPKGKMGFIDEDGDGINDLALDHDGDGIPNGKDPDYVRPQDGSGRKMGQGRGSKNANLGSPTGECDGTGPKGKSNKRGGSR